MTERYNKYKWICNSYIMMCKHKIISYVSHKKKKETDNEMISINLSSIYIIPQNTRCTTIFFFICYSIHPYPSIYICCSCKKNKRKMWYSKISFGCDLRLVFFLSMYLFLFSLHLQYVCMCKKFVTLSLILFVWGCIVINYLILCSIMWWLSL